MYSKCFIYISAYLYYRTDFTLQKKLEQFYFRAQTLWYFYKYLFLVVIHVLSFFEKLLVLGYLDLLGFRLNSTFRYKSDQKHLQDGVILKMKLSMTEKLLM